MMSLELTSVDGVAGDGKTTTRGNATKERVVLSLEQLRAKFAGASNIAAHLCHVPESSTMTFEPCKHEIHPSQLKQRLRVTCPVDTGRKQTVWAHIHAESRTPETMNQVSFCQDDGTRIKLEAIDPIDFVEPFGHIKRLDQKGNRDKFRMVILSYFLEHGHLTQVDFRAHGFDSLRKGITGIAKSRTSAGLPPVRPALKQSFASQPLPQAEIADPTAMPQPPVGMSTTNAATATTIGQVDRAPLQKKRERELTQEEVDDERELRDLSTPSSHLSILNTYRSHQTTRYRWRLRRDPGIRTEDEAKSQ